MTLEQYFKKYPSLNNKNAHLEKIFLETILFPILGEEGLPFLEYQKRIYDNINHHKYYIDFVFSFAGKRYAFEVDGFNYHGRMSAKRFDYQEDRTNEITRQGYELIRCSYNQITKTPDKVRRNISSRINFTPTHQNSVTEDAVVTSAQVKYLSIDNYDSRTQIAGKESILPAKIIGVLIGIILSMTVLYAIYLVINRASVKVRETAERTALNQESQKESNLNLFISRFNSNSSAQITNQIDIDITDKKSPYYRGTNDVIYAPVKEMKAKYAIIQNTPIWIMSCSAEDSSKMRIYAESNNYEDAVNIVRAGIKSISPTVTSSEMQPLEDRIAQRGGYIGVISGVYVQFAYSYQNKFYVVHYSHQCGDGAY